MPPVLDTEVIKLAGTNGGGPHDDGPGGNGGGGDDDDGRQDRDGRHIPGAGLLAMRLALISITALFVTIGIVYFARSRSGLNWQHIRVPQLLWLSTALILSSSWTIENARRWLNHKDSRRYIRSLTVTLCIGVSFLASQVSALQELVAQGIYLRHNPHSSLFYVVTVVHGFHLLGGMGALCYLMMRASNYPPVLIFDYRRQRSRFAVSGLYWHFLTAIWLGIFMCLLLWP
ncbi:MAG TPA: cytochrome c oxidase subunit 3 [Bryobacteraceae bacterium]|nr:cytochrome c oxidase subunit 3 [Bryobacteraceae bacterium]